MPAIIRDMVSNRVLVPSYEAPPVVAAQCAFCEAPIEVLSEFMDAVDEGIEVVPLCVECIPDYLKG